MDVIAMARELGHAIQEMKSYQEMMRLSDECDNDRELQSMVEEFNELKGKINQEIMSDERDDDKIGEMDKRLREVYSLITAHPKMKDLSEAKDTFSETFNYVSQIITAAANGENPDTVELSAGCTGSCSSCSGCH